MPRFWKKKTDRIRRTEHEINQAIEEVKKGNSIRSVADTFGMSKSALSRHVVNARSLPEGEKYRYEANTRIRQVFNRDEENMLAEYLKHSSKMHYGLTTIQARKLAFNYAMAIKNHSVLPTSWTERQIAGREWLVGFMARHPDLSIRSPEATSLARSTSFNKSNVTKFFDNVRNVYSRKQFTPDQIWNVDETGLTTVHNPPKVIAQKGMKQVGQMTSAERGQLVTLCCFINATGNTVPPVFIFPRKNFKDFMLNNAPPGSLGLAHPSGWMTAPNFLLTLRHFISHVKCCKENPVALFLDNHESHITIEIIDEAKSNGVILVTFPPHCSHRLQPLDVSVYGPLKQRYSLACGDWMISNPAKTLTIYNIADLCNKAFTGAMSKENIIKGFEKTGIWPFQPNIFTEDDFLMSEVTDRPDPSTTTDPNKDHSIIENADSSIDNLSSLNVELPTSQTNLPQIVFKTPQDIQPYPKAAPLANNSGRKGRKRGKTRILTDTPEKNEILETLSKKITEKVKKVTRKIDISSSDSDTDIQNVTQDSNEDIDPFSDLEDFDFDVDTINVGDFVVVKFPTKKTIVHYIGIINKDLVEEMCLEIKFLRRKHDVDMAFHFPSQEDISLVQKNDVVLKLPPPQQSGGTQRVRSVYKFPVNLQSHFENIR